MGTRISRVIAIKGVLGAMILGAASCGQPGTLRQNVISQNDAAIKQKYQELAPAEGAYQGTFVLTGSGQSFDATIFLKRSMQTQRDPQSDDPSQTVSLPTLAGCLRFPAISNLQPDDWPGFHALLGPLGGNAVVTFDLGDYDPSSQQLVLPYNVAGSSGGTYGELTGTLKNGQYQGDWFSKPYGDAGTFNLNILAGGQNQCTSSQ
jgi:hypothetical protein